MRKIEEQMLNAVVAQANWTLGNTSVYFSEHLKRSEVFLHGHKLGAYYHQMGSFNVHQPTLKAYPTNTTKSRLRALGVNVSTRKGVTYLNDRAI